VWRRARGPLAGALALAACIGALALLTGGEDELAEPKLEPAPPAFLGIVAEDAFGKPGRYRRNNLGRLRSAGAGIVRQTFDWARIERSPGSYDLRFYDRFVADLTQRNLRVLPIVFNPPPFRSSAPAVDPRRGTYPPARPADMGRFAAVLTRRYGPGGTIWRENPKLPYRPIRSWQIWNEPNLPVYWPTGPDPAAYVRLLRATGRAIERVDPKAEIVMAGLPESGLGTPPTRYLAGMYAAGGAGAFDALALHTFGGTAEDTLAAARAARRVAAAAGDDPGLWITELGWATGGPPSEFRVSEAEQAELLDSTLRAMGRRREDLGLRAVVYFNWRDSLPYEGGRDFFGLHTGLVSRDGQPKPALGAYRGVARTLGQLPKGL